MEAGSSRDRSDYDKNSVGKDIAIGAFYEKVVSRLIKKYSIEEREIEFAIHHMIKNYKQVEEGKLPNDIDFDDRATCLGYLHRYAACHTALVMNVLSALLEAKEKYTISKLRCTSANLIFLGSGPGNDVLGFLLALKEKHENIEDIYITVVDKMSGWAEILTEIFKLFKMIKKPEILKELNIFEDINVKLSFVSADLTDPDQWSDEFHLKLRNADVIFFVKSLSHIPDSRKNIALQTVISVMKKESLILFIDCPFPHNIFSSLDSSLQLVYTDKKKTYNLDYKCSKFGYENISSCQAEVKIFRRH